MPSLSKHQSNVYTKLLIEGDSGSGKTGALASLIGAGYKLRILDYDNGLEALKQFVRRDYGTEGLEQVEYRTLRDRYKATTIGPIVDRPQAFLDGYKMHYRWKYDDTDLGSPSEWGPECILVLDSLTFFSDAGFNWAEPIVPRSRDGKYDVRAVYGMAQKAIESFLAAISSEHFKTNVIVITHIKYVDNPDGTRKGYPTAVGAALSPLIPRYFNSVALCQTQGGKRTIQTTATAMIDLKNPKPFAMLPSYPIDTGLPEFFKVLREPDEPKVEQKVNKPTRRM